MQHDKVAKADAMVGALTTQYQAAIETLGKMALAGPCGTQTAGRVWPSYDLIDRGRSLRGVAGTVSGGMAHVVMRGSRVGDGQYEP